MFYEISVMAVLMRYWVNTLLCTYHRDPPVGQVWSPLLGGHRLTTLTWLIALRSLKYVEKDKLSNACMVTSGCEYTDSGGEDTEKK